MKYKILLSLSLLSNILYAQINKNLIYKSWVKQIATYNNGSSLPDDNTAKYSYIKYTFRTPDECHYSGVYFNDGSKFNFEITGDYLIFKSPVGWEMNKFKIVSLTPDKLILIQSGSLGFDDPNALKFEFIPEKVLQNSLPVLASNIYSIAGDTVYKQNPKIYASFKGDDFQKFIRENLGSDNLMEGKSGQLVVSFIVSKAGLADSLKILESLGQEYDKHYIKAFNKAKGKWLAANLNGKNVRVQMTMEIRYSTSAMMMPAFDYTLKANEQFVIKDYEAALYFYDQALKSNPTDKDNLYKRSICKKMLGNIAGACEDWNKIKELGGTQADALLAQYCK